MNASGKYKRQAVVFNMESPHQRDLYEWCMGQSSNFSGFCKEILFAFKSSKHQAPGSVAVVMSDGKPDDASAMSDIL